MAQAHDLERLGLVDYEIGVAEEEIVQCTLRTAMA